MSDAGLDAARVVLNIHGIGTPAREMEPGEAPFWISRDQFADAIAQAAAAPVPVGFTFDDGNLSDIEIGAELLEAAGFRAAFFVLGARLDTPGSLGGDHLRALIARGHVIGSHGMDHVPWTGLDAAGETREYDTARARIAEAVGAPVDQAAIPFGMYRARVLKGLRARGYARAWSSDGGPVTGRPWLVPRTSLTGAMTGADLADILAGRAPLKTRLRRAVTTRLKKVI